MKKFLVVVDTQFDFMDPTGALYVKGAEEIIPAASEFLRNLNPEDYSGVLFTFDTHLPAEYELSAERQQFDIHCVRYTKGWGNVLPLYDVPQGIPVFTLEKNVFNMWEQERIKLTSKSYGGSNSEFVIDRDFLFDSISNKEAGIQADEIEVFGVASDFCVKWAVDGFVKRGLPVRVIDDLCRGIQSTAKETFDTAEYIGNVAVR